MARNQTLYVYVGQKPDSREILNTEKGLSNPNPGGWNGGGDAVLWTSQSGTGGGGATDVRLLQSTAEDGWSGFDSLKSRIMVAAGGGGGSVEQRPHGCFVAFFVIHIFHSKGFGI